MVLPQSSPDAAKDAQEPRQYHVAALQPAVNERAKENAGGTKGRRERIFCHQRMAVSRLRTSALHDEQRPGILRAHGIHRKGQRKASSQTQEKGSTPIVVFPHVFLKPISCTLTNITPKNVEE
ncbi:hypothetical protein TcCL_ESM08617 [Trypanosoma cruzi]|nr:hypothetical protein TcCL_ESM08617 [Trypanosoma cruzi]